MELLRTSGERDSGRVVRRWAPLFFLVLAGCVVLDVIAFGDEELTFSHRLHIVEEELDCTDCHVGAEDEDEPGMPPAMLCSLCHDEDDEAEKPVEQRIASLLRGDSFASAGMALSQEVIFPHLVHVESLDCAECHVGIEQNEDVRELPPMGMDDCMRCHSERSVANDCRTCHRELSKETAPDSHLHAWMEVHGSVVRSRSEELVDDCTLCHSQQSDCRACHMQMEPRNHTSFWRLRGHGLVARMDREGCATCHRQDGCDRCHADALPVNHRGPWATSRNTHCLSCHQPIQEQGCVTCHRVNPSHPTAAPLPPDHSPAMNCRQCHGLSAPMPHVDNGDQCIQCHR